MVVDICGTLGEFILFSLFSCVTFLILSGVLSAFR